MSRFGAGEQNVPHGVATDVRRRARLDTGRFSAFHLPGPTTAGPGAAGGSSPGQPGSTSAPPRGKNAASIRDAAAAAAAYQEALDKAAEQTNRTVDGHIETLVDGMGVLVQSASVRDKPEHLIQEDNLAMAARADAMVRAVNSLVSLSRGLSISLCLAQSPSIPPPSPPNNTDSKIPSTSAPAPAPAPATAHTLTPSTSTASASTDIPEASPSSFTPAPPAAVTTTPAAGAGSSTPTGASDLTTPEPKKPIGQREQRQLKERVNLLLTLISSRREAAKHIDSLSQAAAALPDVLEPDSAATAESNEPAGNPSATGTDAMDVDASTSRSPHEADAPPHEAMQNGRREESEEDLWGD